MLRTALVTYVGFVMIYVWIYSVDCRIEYPYTPFKLMKQNSFCSKYLLRLCICKDKKRGMIKFTFFLEMLAHLLFISATVFLFVIGFNKWYLNEDFYKTYRSVEIAIMAIAFILPLTVAGAIHDHMTKDKK